MMLRLTIRDGYTTSIISKFTSAEGSTIGRGTVCVHITYSCVAGVNYCNGQ